MALACSARARRPGEGFFLLLVQGTRIGWLLVESGSTIRLYDGRDHGVELFTARQELQGRWLSWLAALFSSP